MKHTTRWLILLLVFCLTLPSGLTAAAAKKEEPVQEQTFTITVGQSFQDADGNALGTAFLDSNSRMLVPLRALAEQMELTVTWDAAPLPLPGHRWTVRSRPRSALQPAATVTPSLLTAIRRP